VLDHINALSHKYTGTDFAWLQEGERRVTVKITSTRVFGG